MSQTNELTYYKGFKIVGVKSTDRNYFYQIKSDEIITNMHLTSEKAAQNVIDTYLKSINKKEWIATIK